MMVMCNEHFNSLDFCRGYISALSYDGPNNAKPVHILSLRKKFNNAGLLLHLGHALHNMSLVGEVQNLGAGYWYPTPLRRIKVHDKKSILLSSSPTSYLIHHFPSLRVSDGIARVSHPEDVELIPEQSFHNWMGIGVQPDTPEWVKSILQKSKNEFFPTNESSGIQFFSHFANHCLWTDKAKSALRIDSLVLFKRDKRLFFGKLRGEKLYCESNAMPDGLRLPFGFAKLTGHPFSISIKNENGFCKIAMPKVKLPKPEWRVIISLCKVVSFGVYLLSDHLSVTLISGMFKNLGCDLR